MRTCFLLVAPAIALSIAFGCGDDATRAAFDPDETDAGAPGAATGLPDATSSNGLCDDAAGHARLAGCHFMQIFAGVETVLGGDAPGALSSGCYALIVSNPNEISVRLRLRHGGYEADGAPFARLVEVNGRNAQYSLLPDGAIPANGIAVVSSVHVPLPPDQANIDLPPNLSVECPGPSFLEMPFSTKGNVVLGEQGQAIELVTDAPVFALNVHAYQKDGGNEPIAPNESLVPGAWRPHFLYPVHLWQKKVLDTGVYKPGHPAKLDNPDIPMGGDDIHFEWHWSDWLGRASVLAAEDGTTITWPGSDGGVESVSLDRGGIATRRNEDDTIGAEFSANKPISVVRTLHSAISWEFPFGDEMDIGPLVTTLPPTAVLGSEYVAVRHADRWDDAKEEPPWRIVGGVDGTKLTYEPDKPAGAPDRVDRGQLAIFESGEPFVVRSQDDAHPFFFGGHMTGGRYLLQRNGKYPNDVSRGGPVSTTELPISRWARRYPFFALMTIPEQYLLVVRRRAGKEVILDCAGELGGWRPAGARFEYTYVPLTGPDLEPIAYGSSRCQAGPHWIESDEPFRATLWGVTTYHRVLEESMAPSSAIGIPLFGDDGPRRSSTQ